MLNEQQGVVRAAAILAVANVVSRVLGLARETVKASLFGASGLLSAFEVAAYVPMSLFELIIGGMVNSALVPVFSEYATQERREALWQVVSMVLSVATAVLLLLIAVVELAAPFIADMVGASEFQDPALRAVSIRLMRLSAPAVLCLGIASIISGVLYALKRFTLPAFMSAVFNGTIVVIALLWPERIESLVIGLLVGSFLQIILQLPSLRDAQIRWHFDWQHPAIRRIIRLYLPIVAGLIVNQLAIALSYRLATSVGDQSVSYMKFATTLYQFPLGLVVTALSMATLPTLAQQAVSHLDAYKQTLADGIKLVITLILPATAGLLALALPIVTLLFERGKFTPEMSATTAHVLQIYLIGLPFAAVDQMLVFASYARQDTWRPALVGVISIVVYSITAVLLLRPIGLFSLMVADAVKHITHTTIMLWLLRRNVGGLVGFGIRVTLLKSVVAAVVTGAIAWGIFELLRTYLPLTSFKNSLIIVLATSTAGLIAYMDMAFLLNITTAKSLPKLLLRRRKQ